MQRKDLQSISLAGMLIGMVVLYGFAVTMEPRKVSISEIEDHEGEYVIVTGTVLEVHSTGGETNGVMTLSDDNATVRIYFSGSKREVQVSDIVEVVGLVAREREGYSISTSKDSSVRIVHHWDSVVQTLPSIAVRPWAHLERNVNISCRIRIPLTDEEGYSYMLIEDEGLPDYSMFITVFGMSVRRGYAGQSVYVCVRIEYDPQRMSFAGIMDSEEHHIWPVELEPA